MEFTKIESLGDRSTYKIKDLNPDENDRFILAKIQETTSWESLDITRVNSLDLEIDLIESYIKIALDNLILAKQHLFWVKKEILQTWPPNTYMKEVAENQFSLYIDLTEEEYLKIMEDMNNANR